MSGIELSKDPFKVSAFGFPKNVTVTEVTIEELVDEEPPTPPPPPAKTSKKKKQDKK